MRASIILAIVAASSVWAQTTVTVSGNITDAISGLPIETAAIALTQNGRPGSKHTHYTDAGGYYSFDEVATGTATVEIDASGFLAFQKTNPADVSIRIASEHLEHNFKLTPAASIAAKVEGLTGGPPGQNISATLLKEDFTDGVLHFTRGGKGAMSAIGPDGSFQFTGLEPGRYFISADPRPGQATRLQTVLDADQKLLPREHPAEGYVQTYFPGTTEFAAALPISLAAGETRIADFKMALRPLFRVSGEIDAPGVAHWQGTLQIIQAGDGANRLTYNGTASIPGPFTVEGLPPGQYIATNIGGPAQMIPNNAATSGLTLSMRSMRIDLPFAITDHDVDGLRIVPGLQPRGLLAMNGLFRMATPGTALPASLSVRYAFPEPGSVSTPVPAAPTGEFWLSGISGDYSVQPVLPPGYAATEVRYGSANYLNSLIPMNGSSPDASVTIVLASQTGSASGSIVDKDSKPIPAEVALLPDPLPANFDFRAIRVVKDDAQGVYTFSSLAPGRYKAVALTGDDRKRDHDMAILGDKLRTADAFEVVAGQSVTINVHP